MRHQRRLLPAGLAFQMAFTSKVTRFVRVEGNVVLVQRGVNLFELFAKHQPGMAAAGCGWLQPGRNFLSI